MKKSSSGKKARVPGGGWSGKAGAMEGLDEERKQRDGERTDGIVIDAQAD
jgi:hypothetical protein